MAKSWEEVTQLPEFQALSLEEKERTREEYFFQIIAPTAKSYDEINQLKADFDASTRSEEQLEAEHEDTYLETGEKSYGRSGMRMIKQAGGQLKSIGEQERQVGGSVKRLAEQGLGWSPSTAFDIGKVALGMPRMIASGLYPEAAAKGQEKLVKTGESLIRDADIGLKDKEHQYRAEDGSLKYYVGHGAEMVFGNILPMMATSVVAGPQAGLGLMFGQVYGEKYADAINEGRKPEEASMDASFHALAEVATESGPLAAALKPGSRFMLRLVDAGFKESLGELINSVAQRAYDEGIVNENTDLQSFLKAMASDEAMREYRDAIILGGGAGLVMAGAGHPATVAAEKAESDRIKSVAENLAFDQVNDADLNYMIETGERMAKTYNDADMAAAVDAYKAERDLRAGNTGQDVRSRARDLQKRKGPLQKAAEKAAEKADTDLGDESGLSEVAPPEAVDPNQEVVPSEPEPQADITAQVRAMAGKDSPKDAVFVANGTAEPSWLPDNAIVVPGQSGTLITTNQEKADLFASDESDATLTQILGYHQTKAEIQEAEKQGDGVFALTVQRGGGAIHTELVSEAALPRAKQDLEASYPGEVIIMRPDDALDMRRTKVAEEQEKAAKQAQQRESKFNRINRARDNAIQGLIAPEQQIDVRESDSAPFDTFAEAQKEANQRGKGLSVVPFEGGYGLTKLNKEQRSRYNRIKKAYNENRKRIREANKPDATKPAALDIPSIYEASNPKPSAAKPAQPEAPEPQAKPEENQVAPKPDDGSRDITKVGSVDFIQPAPKQLEGRDITYGSAVQNESEPAAVTPEADLSGTLVDTSELSGDSVATLSETSVPDSPSTLVSTTLQEKPAPETEKQPAAEEAKPAEREEPASSDAQRVRDGDILTTAGKPFANLKTAERAQKRRGLENTSDVVEVVSDEGVSGYAIRLRPIETTAAEQAAPPAENVEQLEAAPTQSKKRPSVKDQFAQDAKQAGMDAAYEIFDWRNKESGKASVKVAIVNALSTNTPDNYTQKDIDRLADQLYRQVDKQAVGAPVVTDYEANHQNRVTRLGKTKNAEEIEAIKQEEYSDPRRHFEGTKKVESAAVAAEERLKEEAEAADRDRREQAGEWVYWDDAPVEARRDMRPILERMQAADDGWEYRTKVLAPDDFFDNETLTLERRKKPSTAAKPDATQDVAPEQETKPPEYGQTNTVFTQDAAEKAREILRKKLGQVSSGIDPEIMQAGVTLAGYHIEAGARSFSAFAKAMVGDMGAAVRPYLRGWYEGVRYYPGFDNKGMSTAAEIDAFLDAEAAEPAPDGRSPGVTDEQQIEPQQPAAEPAPEQQQPATPEPGQPEAPETPQRLSDEQIRKSLRNVVLQQQDVIDGEMQTYRVNADVAFQLAKGRLSDLAGLLECVRSGK